MRKTQISMNKLVSLALSILEFSHVKVLVCLHETEKWWKSKLCYSNADSLIVYIKSDDIYKDTTEDVETRFYTSIYKDQYHKEGTKKLLA